MATPQIGKSRNYEDESRNALTPSLSRSERSLHDSFVQMRTFLALDLTHNLDLPKGAVRLRVRARSRVRNWGLEKSVVQ